MILICLKVEKAVHNYSHNDGQDQGELTESSEYNSEAKGGQAATPGTDSNDDTPTYVTPDGEITESSVSDVDKKYSPNEEIIKLFQTVERSTMITVPLP